MFKNFFYTFLHLKIFNLNHVSKNKLEPKLDFSEIKMCQRILIKFGKMKIMTPWFYVKTNSYVLQKRIKEKLKFSDNYLIFLFGLKKN